MRGLYLVNTALKRQKLHGTVRAPNLFLKTTFHLARREATVASIPHALLTWHAFAGKGNEDKRGQPIGTGVGSLSWLYVNGQPVVCNRHMEVTALVSSINPSLSMTSDVKEVADFQQEVLWLLYDCGYLERYPMALGKPFCVLPVAWGISSKFLLQWLDWTNFFHA